MIYGKEQQKQINKVLDYIEENLYAFIKHGEAITIEIQTFIAIFTPTTKQENGIAVWIQFKRILNQCG